MPMMAKPKAADPIARLSWVRRWIWRLWERRVVEQFKRDQAATLNALRGKRILKAVVEESGALIVATAHDGRWVVIRGATHEARTAFLEMARYNCHIDGIGRYRDAWWIAVRPESSEGGEANQIVVLASGLTVTDESPGGH